MITEPNLILTPYQSLAFRRAVDAMKADETIFEACPEVVRNALCDILLPTYTTAEAQISDLQKSNEEALKLAERFGRRIQELEAKLARRN